VVAAKVREALALIAACAGPQPGLGEIHFIPGWARCRTRETALASARSPPGEAAARLAA
jgi:hypothetical protein